MLDGRERDSLVEMVERAQVSALHRALDRAYMLGYTDGYAFRDRESRWTRLRRRVRVVRANWGRHG